jgi:hypothetical protein
MAKWLLLHKRAFFLVKNLPQQVCGRAAEVLGIENTHEGAGMGVGWGYP